MLPYFPIVALLASFVPTLAQPSGLTVDLGYSIYQGYHDATSGLNIWKGIRYAAPPIGNLRWALPQPPATDRLRVIEANVFGPRCPQGAPSPEFPTWPFNFTKSIAGSEDCLFLNVYAPGAASRLPVFVYIHGGGYAQLDGTEDPTDFMAANSNGFISVFIQYRLGAFGFLPGSQVQRSGIANAGLQDQHFALQWVRDHIALFGGDADAVTIAGESAGGGSVIQQAIAYGGRDRPLFRNIIASSPYLPPQLDVGDSSSNALFNKFALAALCPPALPNTLSCLRSRNTIALQAANYRVGGSGSYGTFSFVPVVDGRFIQRRPTLELAAGRVNGENVLTSSNANEGSLFTPPWIRSDLDFRNYVHSYYPRLTRQELDSVAQAYSIAPVDRNALLFDTVGTASPTALNESIFAVGEKQRANDFFAETTLSCSSYWLAYAFSGNGRTAYKFQYSHVPGIHSEDILALFPNDALAFASMIPESYRRLVQNVWGNHVLRSSPGPTSTNQFIIPNPSNAWPRFSSSSPMMLDMNVTGGTLTNVPFVNQGATINLPIVTGPGTSNQIRVVDAESWEGGRGGRCRLWMDIGADVPY